MKHCLGLLFTVLLALSSPAWADGAGDDGGSSSPYCSLAGGPLWGTAMGRPPCHDIQYAVRLCGTIYVPANTPFGDHSDEHVRIWPSNTILVLDAQSPLKLESGIGCVFGNELPKTEGADQVFTVKLVKHSWPNAAAE